MTPLQAKWLAYTAALRGGDEQRAARLRAHLNDRYGLRLRDWRRELLAAGLEPLPCSERFDLSDVVSP